MLNQALILSLYYEWALYSIGAYFVLILLLSVLNIFMMVCWIVILISKLKNFWHESVNILYILYIFAPFIYYNHAIAQQSVLHGELKRIKTYSSFNSLYSQTLYMIDHKTYKYDAEYPIGPGLKKITEIDLYNTTLPTGITNLVEFTGLYNCRLILRNNKFLFICIIFNPGLPFEHGVIIFKNNCDKDIMDYLPRSDGYIVTRWSKHIYGWVR